MQPILIVSLLVAKSNQVLYELKKINVTEIKKSSGYQEEMMKNNFIFISMRSSARNFTFIVIYTILFKIASKFERKIVLNGNKSECLFTS